MYSLEFRNQDTNYKWHLTTSSNYISEMFRGIESRINLFNETQYRVRMEVKEGEYIILWESGHTIMMDTGKLNRSF